MKRFHAIRKDVNNTPQNEETVISNTGRNGSVPTSVPTLSGERAVTTEHVLQEPREHIILPQRHIPVVHREQVFARSTASYNTGSTVLPVVAPKPLGERRQSTFLEQEQRYSVVAHKNARGLINSGEKKDVTTFPEHQTAEQKATRFVRPKTPAPKKQTCDAPERIPQIKLPRIPLDKLLPFCLSDSEPVAQNEHRPVRPSTAAPPKQKTDALCPAPVPGPISPPKLHRRNQATLFAFRLEDSDSSDNSDFQYLNEP